MFGVLGDMTVIGINYEGLVLLQALIRDLLGCAFPCVSMQHSFEQKNVNNRYKIPNN